MDLNEFWQESKNWILGVLAGVVLFFLADSWIRGNYDTGPARRSLTRAKTTLRKGKWYGAEDLRAARETGETLRARLDEARNRTLYRPREAFRLEGKGDPSLHYLSLTSKVREEIKRGMDAANVDFLAQDLGLPSQSPVDREEIRRVLVGLDILSDALERLLRASEGVVTLPGFHHGLTAVENLRIQGGRGFRRNRRPRVTSKSPGIGERITARIKFRADSLTLESFLENLLGDGGEGGSRPLLCESISIEDVGREPGEPLLVECTLVALSGGGS